jgi:hypothetical protein
VSLLQVNFYKSSEKGINVTKQTLAAIAASSAIVIFASAASATSVPVDLSGWTAEGGSSSWAVQTGNDSVIQGINGDPTFFFKPGSDDRGTTLKGTIRVNTTNDDDFIGFVLGYQAGEHNSATADFWLIDWKQADQNAGGSYGTGTAGIALSHVTGAGSLENYWQHDGVVNEVARGTNLGSTGWADNTEYSFDLVFTSSKIEVFVDGVLEISEAGSFGNGAFGFYNYSQDQVEYAGLTTAPAVPLPAALPLLLAGFGAFGVAGLRRKG